MVRACELSHGYRLDPPGQQAKMCQCKHACAETS